MVFNLFDNLLDNPAILFVLAFLFLIMIVTLLKVDALEKKVEELINKVNSLKKKIETLSTDVNTNIEGERDIIDKFLSQKGFEILGNKESKNKNNMDTILHEEKVSHLIDPREEL